MTCLEDWQEISDVFPLLVVLLTEADGAVHSVVLGKEGAAAEPHPVAIVHKVVCVHQQPIEGVSALLPGHIQVSPGQKAGLQRAQKQGSNMEENSFEYIPV